MEVVKFVNGKYSYITNHVSGDIIRGEKADEIVNNPSCILYSPMITTYNLGEKSKKNHVSLYDDRIQILSRGGEWRGEFCIKVDNLFNICGAGFNYLAWHGRWEKRQLSPEEFIQYLNLIEQKGIPYVRDLYFNLLRQELNEIRNTKYFSVEISDQLKGIQTELQRLNYEGEVNLEIAQTFSYIKEAQEKASILTAKIAEVEEHYKLYES